MSNIEQKIEELRFFGEELDRKIGEIEKKLEQPQIKELEQFEDIKRFDLLRVFKLYASLPIYTAARTGQLDGEIYLTNISGTRKICAYISGTEYCATIT